MWLSVVAELSVVAVCGGHSLKVSNIVQLFMFSTHLLPECIANS